MELFVRLAALLAVLLVGTGLRASGALDTGRTRRLNAGAYYVALPALLFVSTYDHALGELVSIRLVVGVVVVLGTAISLAWVVHRSIDADGRRSVAIVQSYHSNLGYLGVPLIAATFSEEITAVASVVLGLVTPVQVAVTVVVLTTYTGSTASLGRELSRVGTNPIMLSLLAGFAVGSTSLSVPSAVVVGLDALGSIALPLALLCVGASLSVDGPVLDRRATGAVLGLKLLAVPAIAWTVFTTLGVDDQTFVAAMVMFATPTAVSTYVFAETLGGDAAFASLNVFVTTVGSIGTLFVLITILS